jgi:hypothetical protein
MPLKHAQAKDKEAVFAEIRREYPGPGVGHDWRMNNFNFAAPSDAWLRGLKSLAAIKVQLKGKSLGFDVLLVGESTAGGQVFTNVGTIRDAR